MQPLRILAILPVLILAGCSPIESKLVGKWKTDTGLSEAKGDQPGDRLLKGLSDFAKTVGPQIEFRKDHTFTMIMLFTIDGTWKADGNTIICTPDHVSGLEMSKDKDSREPFRVRLSDDGQTLIADEDGKPHWTLKRVP